MSLSTKIDSKNIDVMENELVNEIVDDIETKKGMKRVGSEYIKRIISIVEEFIRSEKLICYGGTAINNILPKEEQFYNKLVDLPDYDVFSKDALNKAKLLADIFYKAGYKYIQAKSGVHAGTFKVFVDFIPVADITYLDPKLFNIVIKETFVLNGIHYAPPNYLRMEMYKELSRPDSDISRWEKVLTRLNLLNSIYPITNSKCNSELFKRDFERNNTVVDNSNSSYDKEHGEVYYKKLYDTIKNNMISQGVVFFGCYAMSIYSRYMDKKKMSNLRHVPDFDILSENPEVCSETLKSELIKNGFKNVVLNKKVGYGEIISSYYEVYVEGEAVCFIYKTFACHNYNTIFIGKQNVKVASIDTMNNLFLAMYYSKQSKHNQEKILCMTNYLYELQMKNRLNKKGILKRFSSDCYGHQETIEEIKMNNEKLFNDFSRNRIKKSDLTYQKYFMKYKPNSRTVKLGIKNEKKINKDNEIINKKKTKKVGNNAKKGGKWTLKYKKSINCVNPKGFSQKQYCKYKDN